MSDALIPPAFLFRFAIPCFHYSGKWTNQGVSLREIHVIPSFHAEFNLGPRFAELRMGWNDAGLYFHLRTTGKKQSIWCRDGRPEDSDGLTLWIATRPMKDVHRAVRFCHRFVFLPQGGGRLLSDPVAILAPVARAREEPHRIPPRSLHVLSEKRPDGYQLQGHIAAEALTGFDPTEHPRLSFSYAVADRELGWQTFHLGPEYPFSADPTLWGTLELRPDTH